MEETVLVLKGKWLTNLKQQIVDMDYCFLCDCHPSHEHDRECPLKGLGERD